MKKNIATVLILSSLLSACGGGDSGSPTDPIDPTDPTDPIDPDPADPITPTPLNLIAPSGQLASITDTDEGDTGELMYKFSNGMTTGRHTLSLYYDADETESAYVSLFDSATSTSSLIGELKLTAGDITLRGEDEAVSSFNPGNWLDIELIWDTSSTTEVGSYYVVIDGTLFGPYDSQNITPGVEVTATTVKFSSNLGTADTSLYVDNYTVYSDIAATTKLFEDDFEGYDAGTVLNDIATDYHAKSFSAVVVESMGTVPSEPDEPYTGVPYDYTQYQDALDVANLQQNDLDDCTNDDINDYCSKSDVVSAGDYEGYDSEYFYIDATSGWLTFEMQGKSNRTELRFKEDFKIDSSDEKYTLTAEILPINPSESVADSDDGKEMTLLQIHNKGTDKTDDTVLSHPLLRIVWDGESRTDVTSSDSYSNAYWAILKTNAYECSDSSKLAYIEDCPDSYEYHYLADFDANNATKFEIIAGNKQLIVNVDDSEVLKHDISYWSALYSYFKAGVYNQFKDGNSVVQFKTLTYKEGSFNEPETELPMNDLDASAAPSVNFDLSQWNLSIPRDNGEELDYVKATAVTVEELNDDYQDQEYFWTDIDDGGMVFKAYIDGGRTSENTTYTRSELREMLRGTNTSIPTQGINGNNWVFSSVPEELQEKAGGVDGNMVATLAVNHVTTTGKESYRGRVIVGQIHAASDEPIRIYYRLLPGHTKGSIYFAHEPSNGNDEQWYEMIGERSSSADEPEDGIELNEKFSYEIDIAGDTMTVSIMRDGKDTITEEVDMSDSGYNTGYYDKSGVKTEDYMYFKAGVYNQNKLVDEDEDGEDDYDTDPDDYVQATFYYLNITH